MRWIEQSGEGRDGRQIDEQAQCIKLHGFCFGRRQ
jgi:hypothetical protein